MNNAGRIVLYLIWRRKLLAFFIINLLFDAWYALWAENYATAMGSQYIQPKKWIKKSLLFSSFYRNVCCIRITMWGAWCEFNSIAFNNDFICVDDFIIHFFVYRVEKPFGIPLLWLPLFYTFFDTLKLHIM